MELTIDQALQKAVEAHKAGQVKEADHLYTAILKAQPKHPDANHNLGVLAVSVGKATEALPFLKTALEANPSIAQFWLSYIDVLIKLDRTADAKVVLEQAKSKGAKGDSFDKLDQRLQNARQVLLEAEKVADEPQPKQPNILDSLKLDQAIKLARKNENEGALNEAKSIYQDVLLSFPKNKRAKEGLKRLERCANVSTSKIQDPPQAQVQALINLYSQGQLKLAIDQVDTLIKQFPNSAPLFNIQGAILKGLGRLDLSVDAYNKALAIKPDLAEAYNNIGNALQEQSKLEEAIEAYKKALVIKPDFAEAYNNMGNALQEQSKLEEAIEAYKKTQSIKPDFADAYNNMGNTLQKQGKLDEATEVYKKALAIKPDYAEAYNNMGNSVQEQGKLEEAIEAYMQAVAIKPEYADAIENAQNLAVQLLPVIANYPYDFDDSDAKEKSEIVFRPKYQIQNAIKAYLKGDFTDASLHTNNFKDCDHQLLKKLALKDNVFCNAYSDFIEKLLDADWDNGHTPEETVYHLGESHSLSYAHRNITISGSKYRITPRITFGGKAFHFSQTKFNNFKAITKAHFTSLPVYSKVFLSFGEIDCRAGEGFISAAAKCDTPLEQLIEQTVKGYVDWFLDQNVDKKHNLYFVNVPAPVYNNKHSADLNSKVAKTVALFNTALKNYTLQLGVNTLDVFKFTTGKEGFSNGLFHIDNYHLGAKALAEIERQLS